MSRNYVSIVHDLFEKIVEPAFNMINIGLDVYETARLMYENYGQLSIDELLETVVNISSDIVHMLRIGYGIIESSRAMYENN